MSHSELLLVSPTSEVSPDKDMTRSATGVQWGYPKMEQWWSDSFLAVLAVLTHGSQSNQVCVGGKGARVWQENHSSPGPCAAPEGSSLRTRA